MKKITIAAALLAASLTSTAFAGTHTVQIRMAQIMAQASDVGRLVLNDCNKKISLKHVMHKYASSLECHTQGDSVFHSKLDNAAYSISDALCDETLAIVDAGGCVELVLDSGDDKDSQLRVVDANRIGDLPAPTPKSDNPNGWRYTPNF